MDKIILLNAIVGSQAYGTNTPDSDKETHKDTLMFKTMDKKLMVKICYIVQDCYNVLMIF